MRRGARLARPAVAVALAALAAAGCGKEAGGGNASAGGDGAVAAPATANLNPTTPAAKSEVPSATWATYREVGTIDPAQAFDYPENTVITSMCESLLRQEPDGSIVAGLAEPFERPDPKTVVITLREGPKFWNGKPVTADDVVFSLKRMQDPATPSFYPATFSRVSSIAKTGDREVTLKLSEPDFWLDGQLSQMAGVVVEKAFAEKAGKKLGTPQGGIMCSGAYELGKWTPGTALTVKRHDAYWDAAQKAKVGEVEFRGVPDESALTSGLLTGEIDGTYTLGVSTFEQLQASKDLKVSAGPSWALESFVVSDLKGVLGDVKVRQALSMAIDRQGYIQTVLHGQAQLPRTLANPGGFASGKAAWEQHWNALPEPKLDVEGAKKLVEEAGATGKTLTIGMSSEVSAINAMATALREAGTRIGLKVKLKSVSAANFINFFTDPKAREGVDGFPTVNYSDYASPVGLWGTFALKDGSQNYSGYENPQVTKLMGQMRAEADPDKAAELGGQIGDILAKDLPWIAVSAPNSVLVTNAKLTGAPTSFTYMGGPWANLLGGV